MHYQRFNQAFWDLCEPNRDFSRFAAMRKQASGMSSDRIGAMLAMATSLLEPDESYLEVGTYRGYSLVSAAAGTGNRVTGIDNFCQFDAGGENREKLRETLRRYGKPNIHFIEADFASILPPRERIGVYFYDGAHEVESTVAGLEWALPSMARTGIIILDDYSLHSCDRGILEFQKRNPTWRILLGFKNTELRVNVSEGDWAAVAKNPWWTGICVLYHAN